MGDEKTHKEMLEQFEKKGKRVWDFEEIAEMMNRNEGIPKQETKRILKELAGDD